MAPTEVWANATVIHERRDNLAKSDAMRYNRPMGAIDFSRLSTDERLDLIGALWDSLELDTLNLSHAQNDELVRRLATFEKDKATALPWREVEAAVFNRQR